MKRPASGLRWLSLMLLTPIPRANHIWACPFLMARVPSQRYDEERGHRHKALTDWVLQMLQVVQRWWPGRQLIVVADSAYAVVKWLSDLQQGRPITVITRLRLDAALYAPAPERGAGQRGRPRLKGNRFPTLASLVYDPETHWERVNLNRWSGKTDREVEIVSQTAVWYHSGLPPLPVRGVLARDPEGRFSAQALLCLDLLQTHSRSWSPSCNVGSSRSPVKRFGYTWVWKRSASGPILPLREQPQRCWGCSHP